MAKRRKADPRVKQYATELCALYYDALRSAMLGMNLHRASRGVNFESNYATLDGVAKRAFRNAAAAAMQVGAEPREYVVAQFQRWAEISQWKGKTLLPMPTHLASLGAQARYIQFKLQKAARTDRAPKASDSAHREFFREERKLKGLVRMLRNTPEDVLAESPEEFSREFLEHKMVWPLVQVRWQERRA